ncbi:AAA+ ATPase domain-containing protein [Cynara cardunculus var. scolymus]|uniref:ABC-type xenobiotic transporter n=1 Tax=Cynara cardunculus var. scolymus TaxID=59895 RepID=A0A103XJD0_CYNCS|nr:AAA+ ATPase domain-containing protein [Cynara cardunculus var. scolymus]
MVTVFDRYFSIYHVTVVSIDTLLLFTCLFIFFYNLSSTKMAGSVRRHWLPVWSTGFNGCLGFVYLGLGIWMILEKLSDKTSLLPPDGWLVAVLQGGVWLLILSLERRRVLPKIYSILILLFTIFLCFSSIWEDSVHRETTLMGVLNVLTFPGAVLFVICVFREQKQENIENGSLYAPLQAEERSETDENVTPMAKAGILSIFTFWWLNPLLVKGKRKVLDGKDIPYLRPEDRAESCYSRFMEKLEKRKDGARGDPSILSTLFIWKRKDLVITGFFALIKVLSLASGPLIIRAFIRVCQGMESFKHEGYFLAFGLFLAKCLESISERQLNFRNRLIGLQVKSMLCAAIYRKQLRLSNVAKLSYGPGEIMNYATVDATRIGEFPFWFHQIWTIGLQITLGILIIFYSVGMATFAALFVVILTVLGNLPMGKLQHKYLTKLMAAQDRRLKAIAEAITNMKVLKLYAWETHFRKATEMLRKEELRWLSAVITQRGGYLILFWSAPVFVSIATFWTCYFLGIPLDASNVFTFLATIRIIQEPIRLISDVAAVFIEARVALTRIIKFLEAPELQRELKKHGNVENKSVIIESEVISWTDDSSKPTLAHVNLEILTGEKVAICGEVGSGKSTLVSAILGETAWIQTGTIQENILFGSEMDDEKYQEVVTKCSLVKDIEMFPFGDQTIIGERGVNLSGGQKQRVQLARALYQDADEYIMEALSSKTVLLVTHQVDFLPAFDDILLMADGKIVKTGTYSQLLDSCKEFQNLVIALSDTSSSDNQAPDDSKQISEKPNQEIQKISTKEQIESSLGEQLIKQEEREAGDTGLKPYKQYLGQSNGYFYFFLSVLSHISHIIGTLLQNLWLAREVQDSNFNWLNMLLVYMGIGVFMMFFLFGRSYFVVKLGVKTSMAVFSKLITSLFRAPMSFYDSTPVGRIISRVSSDLNIVDLELAMKFTIGVGTTMNTYFSFAILAFLTWPVLFIIIPTVYITILLQELMRLDGTSKSLVASHLAQSIAGVVTIRAFGEEDRFFSEHLRLIDGNASPFFHSFSANEWLIQRLEILCAVVISSSALAIRYQPNSPLVLQGISCIFEGGDKIGIVGRTGSGKTTLISALFRLVEPTDGKIIVDEIDITTIGLHDLRSNFGIIPQEPTLFSGSVLDKCQLLEAIQDKKEGLDSLGKVMEYDKPMKLMNEPASLFGLLVNEYWSQHKPS